MNIFRPIHVNPDFPMTVNELNEYTQKHTDWINSTSLSLLPTGDIGFHHLNDLNGVYIHRWISHNDLQFFQNQSEKDLIHSILAAIDHRENVILVFEDADCFMVYCL